MASPTVMSRDEVSQTTLGEIAELCDVPVNQIEDVYACTPLQTDMISGTRPEMFNFVLCLSPEVDIDRFCEALRQLVSFTPILRTRFVKCQLGFVQVVINEEHVTMRQSRDVEEYLCDNKSHRLRLGEPAFRSVFINGKFVATMDHTIMDHWCVAAFLEDVMYLYYGYPPKMRTPFKEFVAQCLSIDDSAAKIFWASKFKGIPTIFPKVSPGVLPHGRQTETRKIDLKRVGHGIALVHVPSFIEAAWALTASIYADSEIVAFGKLLSGRSTALNGIETTLGPIIAEIPVQVNLQRNMTVEGLVKDRNTSMRQIQTHPALHYGISRISAVNEAAHIASRFQTLLNIRPADIRPGERDELIVLDRVVWPFGPFALDMVCKLLDGGISIVTRFDPAILCERQMYRVLNQFEYTMRLLMEVPLQTKLDKLPLLNPQDASEILQWSNTIAEPVEKCVHEAFSALARAQPNAIAVEASDGNASYSKLDQMSDRLAQELQRKGVSVGNTVALVFERSLWAIVAVLGIMKAGGVCVPIDKHDSNDRKALIVSEANIKTVLTSSAEYANSINLTLDVFVVSAQSIATLPEFTGLHNNRLSSPEDLAYIMFTSGTGALRGIMLEHRSLVSSLNSTAQRLSWQPNCRILHFATHVSSISLGEIFGALLFGGCLVIPSEQYRESNLSNFIESAKVNWALLTPRVLRNISPEDVPSLQSLLSIGEIVDSEAFKIWGGALRFFNGWGVCEASIISTVAELTPSSQYPESIGIPVGCAVWIVNPQSTSELVPIGGIGELLIEGSSMARGYLNSQTKTAASFISPPAWASGKNKFFKTGDLAKYNPDGSISFIGRQENRVKLGGQKLQLEGVESVLASCIEVRDVITLVKISAGRTQLCAVISLADPQLPQTSVLQEVPDIFAELVEQRLDAVRVHAKSRLPSDRVPTIWIPVENLPLTAPAKLDRIAIREWLKTKVLTQKTDRLRDELKS